MKKLLLTASLSMAITGAAQAQSLTDMADEIIQGWSGYASVGGSISRGNADAASLNGSIRLGKTVNRWEHLLYGSVERGEASSVRPRIDANGDTVRDPDTNQIVREIVTETNTDRINLGYQPKYYWRPKTYFFGLLDYESDEPANVDNAYRQIIGVGHKFWSDNSGFLSGEIGIGNKNVEPIDGDDVDGGIGYLGVNYLNRITDTTTFNADLRSDFGDATFIELGLGLAFKLTESLALKVSHFTRSNSDITDLRNSSDTVSGLFDSSSDSVTTFNLVLDI